MTMPYIGEQTYNQWKRRFAKCPNKVRLPSLDAFGQTRMRVTAAGEQVLSRKPTRCRLLIGKRRDDRCRYYNCPLIVAVDEVRER